VKIGEGQQKIKIVRSNQQSNLRGSCQSNFSLPRAPPLHLSGRLDIITHWIGKGEFLPLLLSSFFTCGVVQGSKMKQGLFSPSSVLAICLLLSCFFAGASASSALDYLRSDISSTTRAHKAVGGSIVPQQAYSTAQVMKTWTSLQPLSTIKLQKPLLPATSSSTSLSLPTYEAILYSP